MSRFSGSIRVTFESMKMLDQQGFTVEQKTAECGKQRAGIELMWQAVIGRMMFLL